MNISRNNPYSTEVSQTTKTQSVSLTESSSFIGKNDFFKILSAQLKYQDPMSGGDNNAYIAQMSQFAMIEKMENMVESLDALYNLNATGQAVNLIGKTVTMDTNESGLVTGTIDRIEVTKNGIQYAIGDKLYAYPAILKIGEEAARTIGNVDPFEVK
jgi:flagellar basal-body rod modification protein FlgD